MAFLVAWQIQTSFKFICFYFFVPLAIISGNESDKRWRNMDLRWDGNEEGLAEVKWSLCCDIATAAASSLCVQFLTRSWHCFEAKHFHFLFLQISVSFIRFKHYCYVRRWPPAELSITTVCTTGARNVLISISSSSHWNESHDIIIVLSCSYTEGGAPVGLYYAFI